MSTYNKSWNATYPASSGTDTWELALLVWDKEEQKVYERWQKVPNPTQSNQLSTSTCTGLGTPDIVLSTYDKSWNATYPASSGTDTWDLVSLEWGKEDQQVYEMWQKVPKPTQSKPQAPLMTSPQLAIPVGKAGICGLQRPSF